MKNVFNYCLKALVCIVIFTTAGCDDIEEATQITLNESFIVTVPIQIDEATPTASNTLAIDLSSNPEINDFLDTIESVEITSATYVIKDFQGSQIAVGTALISSSNQEFGVFSHNFQSDSQSQKVFELVGASKLQALANVLKNTNQITFNYQVTQEEASNSNFNVALTLQVKIIAQAL